MTTVDFKWDDCGRAAGERNDCTVRAVAVVCNQSYAEAHARLAELGRKWGRPVKRFATMVEPLGLELRPELSCRTLEKVLPEMTVGRFLVRIAHHCFAVVDGKVIDTHPPKPKCRVRMVYTANQS